ncbi:sigma-70 family RNA polymerase sigma factor [Longimicrobium sp.]|uniref:RNA polymerase sigma factor n=1 Tax=Longimicrobium sp. TaxID=2029185 RepID=UPI002E30ECE3|nr:sigma-70 family RNA polymerase sigma factor [Longimicrobium sp.]HEX6039199.1 sigma-70 family RNA polymerase sigma factor [Longimicrobium sp.]
MSDSATQDRFVVLVDEHRKILYKVASAYCREPADRADLEQEIVAQLWRSFSRYDARYRFSTWMYRIALNVAISYVRGESRRRRTLVPAEESILQVAADDAGHEPDERLPMLRAFIQQLGELDRALIILYLDDHRYDAIAEIVGISESNVGTRISRIKQRLRRELTQPA